MRPRHLLLLIALSLCLWGCAPAPAAGEASPSPAATPSPSPSVTTTPADPTWALHWRAQATRNRRPLPRLRYCLGLPSLRPLPTKPSLSASQPTWARYGQRCKRLAVNYIQSAKRLRQRLWHPVIVNYMDWQPLVRWYWPRGGPAWHCPACGASGTTIVSQALHTIYHESGGRETAGSGTGCAGLFQLCSTWERYCPHGRMDGASNIRGAWILQRGAGWSPWAWWQLP